MDIIEVINLKRIRFVQHVWENEECLQNFSWETWRLKTAGRLKCRCEQTSISKLTTAGVAKLLKLWAI